MGRGNLTFLVGALVGFAICYLILTNWAQKNTPDNALQQEPHASAHPNAPEVFRLRSECARIGERILAANVVSSDLTQEQVSHYEPRTAHCYVELVVHTVDLTKMADYNMRNLYDGQTNELLAFSGYEKGQNGEWYTIARPK